MNIIIDKAAVKYIKSHTKDSSIMIFLTKGGGWCAVPIPTVQLGIPQSQDGFDAYDVEGINVYIKKNTRTRNNELHIFLRKFLWLKDLAVDGVRITI